MPGVNDADGPSETLARRALKIALILSGAGSGLGVFAIAKGIVTGAEIPLILCCFMFSVASFVALVAVRTVPLQTIATVATIFDGLYLCAGCVITVTGSSQHVDFFIYLLWFFPLLVFNQLVNAPVAARFNARFLRIAPIVLIACLFGRLTAIFKPELMFVAIVFALSYLLFGSMFTIVTRYREKYIVERERTKSLQVESELLESISDCFLSLDAALRLTYLNDAACAEFGVERDAALNDAIANVVPDFLSASMLAGLRAAAGMPFASVFEALNEKQTLWYEVRCFPRPDGMSIFFRNVTESVLSRRKLDDAYQRLGEQAELLDKAQDAIFVVDLDDRFIYWNKSAERLYGWTAAEVTGRRTAEIFADVVTEITHAKASVMGNGEWSGELTHRRDDGVTMIVESRCTLVRNADGLPRSILAINTDITTRKAAEAQIERLAFYDALTNLPNRMLLRDGLNRALAAAMRQPDTGALLFIDLDDFKTLNDALGHDMGDLLLQQVALRLRACVRAGDTVARLGGDEFVVMCERLGADPLAAAAKVKSIGDAILAAFADPFVVGDYEHATSASVGVALFAGRSDTADELLKRADLAMYRAKARGGNAMCFFDPEMQTFVAARAALQADLRRAHTERAFDLYYQPQVDRNGTVVGAEALLRWWHPERGFVPPSEFIPLAEASGFIVELGRWVLETACLQLAAWARDPQTEHLTIAVNVSPRQFLDADLVELVRDVLRETKANPHRLKLEITESCVIANIDDTVAKMMQLKADGVGFSLDDFGTGYSSLAHVTRLPLDQLKIDKSFVSDVLTNSKVASIVRTIVALGTNLDLAVIAEGVETPGQRDFLAMEGCGYYQGYLFSAALPAACFEAFAAGRPALEAVLHR